MSKQLELLQKLTDATMQRPQIISLGGGGEGGMPGWTRSGTSFTEGKPRTTRSGDGSGGDGAGDGAGAGITEAGLTEDSKGGRSKNVDIAERSEGTLLEAPEERLLFMYETAVRLFRLCKNVCRRGARNASAFYFSSNVLSS